MNEFFHVKFFQNQAQARGDFQVLLGNKNCSAFAEWNWNGDKFTLSNDRYGFYPVYFYSRGNEFAVSPSMTKLLEFAGDWEFNEDALAVFLRFSSLIADDTLFSSIRAVPPGSVLTWQHGKLKIDSQGIIEKKPLKIARQDAIAVYAELFQKAVEKTLPQDNNFVVPLSGGRDSRHILFALCKAQRRPEACLTLFHPPPRPNEDARIAKLICETLKIKHHLIGQKNSRFETEIRKNKLSGFGAYEHGWFLAMPDFIKDKWNVVYDGIAGDVFSAGVFLSKERWNLFRKGKFKDLTEKIFEREGYIPALLTKELYKKVSRERAVNHISEEFARHVNQPDPVGSFYFWNRTRRCIALSPFRLFDGSAKVITPYLETELFDFIASLPAEIYLDKEFHTDTIAFAFPEYAHIPYDDQKSPPVFDSDNFKKLSRDIFRYSTTKRNRRFTNRLFFLPRYLRCIADKNYCKAAAEYGEQAIHLLQLERL